MFLTDWYLFVYFRERLWASLTDIYLFIYLLSYIFILGRSETMSHSKGRERENESQADSPPSVEQLQGPWAWDHDLSWNQELDTTDWATQALCKICFKSNTDKNPTAFKELGVNVPGAFGKGLF